MMRANNPEVQHIIQTFGGPVTREYAERHVDYHAGVGWTRYARELLAAADMGILDDRWLSKIFTLIYASEYYNLMHHSILTDFVYALPDEIFVHYGRDVPILAIFEEPVDVKRRWVQLDQQVTSLFAKRR